MKNRLLIVVFFISNFYLSFGQILYDSGPIIINSEFTIQGNSWNSNHLKYYIQNGTNDIPSDFEKTAISKAFDIWSCYTPLTFTETNSASDAEIVILWTLGEHGDNFPFDDQNGFLAHAFFPPPNGSLAGDIHFDDSEDWTLDLRSNSLQPIDLVTVAAHEIGHSLGLDHSSESDALMYAYYNGSHRYLDIDDINGIKSIYGLTYNSDLSDIDYLCNSNPETIFFLDNCNTGLGVSTWQSSSNVKIISYSNNSVTIETASSFSIGEGWVSATLNNGFVIKENFWIGSPSSEGLTMYSSGSFNISTHRWYQLTAHHSNYNPAEHNQLSYEWQIPYAQLRLNLPKSKAIGVYPTHTGTYPYKVRAKSKCGNSPWISKLFVVSNAPDDNDLIIAPADYN